MKSDFNCDVGDIRIRHNDKRAGDVDAPSSSDEHGRYILRYSVVEVQLRGVRFLHPCVAGERTAITLGDRYWRVRVVGIASCMVVDIWWSVGVIEEVVSLVALFLNGTHELHFRWLEWG